MSLSAYIRTQWEYLFAVALLLVSSCAACWAAVEKQYGLAGMASLCAIGFYAAAIAFAEADTWRAIKEDAARRQQGAEGIDG